MRVMLHYQTRVAAIGNKRNIKPPGQSTHPRKIRETWRQASAVSPPSSDGGSSSFKHRLRSGVDYKGGNAGTISAGEAVFRTVHIWWEHLCVEGDFTGDVWEVVELREQILRDRAIGAMLCSRDVHIRQNGPSLRNHFFKDSQQRVSGNDVPMFIHVPVATPQI